MGREIRRVPPNWEHPRYEHDEYPAGSYVRHAGDYIPLKRNYNEQLKGFERDIKKMGLGKAIDYWGYAPRSDQYVHYSDEEATWYQAYETVSEGTPMSPPFATKDELIEYLVEYGDFWHQRRPNSFGKADRAAVEKFVREDGYAVSLTINNGVIKTGIETALT